MSKATKRKAPSRIKYEGSHPTVSCRVPRKLYDRLHKAKATEDKSFADFLKIGLGVVELQATNEADLKKQGYSKGYKKGYADAESVFMITYPCNICGKTMIVSRRRCEGNRQGVHPRQPLGPHRMSHLASTGLRAEVKELA